MKLSHTLTLALMLTLTGCAQANTQATQPMTQATEVAHTAPTTQPTQAHTQPTTQPVAAPTTAPTTAPVAAPTEQPTEAPLTAPVAVAPAQPTTAPIAPTAHAVVPTTAPCEEDEPCWDCKTMGNKICGPVATAQPVQTPATPVKCSQLKLGDGGTTQQHNCINDRPSCPPVVKGKDGVNIAPANAPKECVYVQ